MSSLVDIQSQIEKLQKQASQIKAKEFDKTVLEIRQKMAAFGITAKDLQAPKNAKTPAPVQPTKKRAAAGPKKVSSTPVPAKYRGAEGQTWSGRGLTPRWLAAL
ncbi:MAG: H-NS histone family protein, partial [Pseudomonadota bacterium]